jgi:hypothetical protein
MAEMNASSLKIFFYDSGVYTQVATVACPAQVVGRTYSVVCRSVGNNVDAECWVGEPIRGGTPAATVTFSMTESTVPKASDMGEARVGYGIVRSYYPSAGTTGYIKRYRFLPYSFDGAKSPRVVHLKGVPGTAPARATVELRGGPNAVPFGVIGWRQFKPHNLIWNGDAAADQDAWTGSGSNLGAGATLLRFANGGPNDLPYMQSTSSVNANSGMGIVIYDRVRAGREYTAEFWANEVSGSWGVAVAGDGTSTSFPSVTTPAGVWTKQQISLLFPTDREKIEFQFYHPATVAGEVLRIAGLRMWEGKASDAPRELSNIDGRGAKPPFGLFHAENDDISARVGFAPATAAGALTGRRMIGDIAVSISTPSRLEYLIAPDLLVPVEDGGSDAMDFEVYAVYTYPGIGNGTVSVTASLTADDFPLAIRQYTRENGSSGKRLVQTGGGTLRRCTRLGTLTASRETRGRLRMRIELKATAGASGNFALEYLALLPTNARAASPSGLVYDSTYPILIPAAYSKILQPDLSASLTNGVTETRDSGLSGSPIELPSGEVELFAMLHEGAVSDDPTIDTKTAADVTAMGLHVGVTPRYYLFRSS